MAHPVEGQRETDGNQSEPLDSFETRPDSMADLKIFWGPEICRLEYLLYLVRTGRIRDEHRIPMESGR